MTPELITLEEWKQLTPRSQGYVHYMQAEHEGSELPKESPYSEGSKEAEAFNAGAFAAMLEAQDSEG